MKLTEQELRENFERWAQTQFETPIDFFHEWQGNCYLNDEFDAMWEGFKACYAMMQDTVENIVIEDLSKWETLKWETFPNVNVSVSPSVNKMETLPIMAKCVDVARTLNIYVGKPYSIKFLATRTEEDEFTISNLTVLLGKTND